MSASPRRWRRSLRLLACIGAFLAALLTTGFVHAHADHDGVPPLAGDDARVPGHGVAQVLVAADDGDQGNDSHCAGAPLHAACAAGGPGCMATADHAFELAAHGRAARPAGRTEHVSGIVPSPPDHPPR